MPLNALNTLKMERTASSAIVSCLRTTRNTQEAAVSQRPKQWRVQLKRPLKTSNAEQEASDEEI